MADVRFSTLDAAAAAAIDPAADLLVLEDVSADKYVCPTPSALVGAVPASVVTGNMVGIDAGNDDTYAVTITPAPPALVLGLTVLLKATTTNTGACSLQVNSLAAKSIKVGASDPNSSAIRVGGNFALLVYDGSYFQLLNPAT